MSGEEWRTCRFCRVGGSHLTMYGARHHAHPKCLVAALGWPETLRRLGSWDVEVFHTAREIATEALACGDVIEWPTGIKFMFGTTDERRVASLRSRARVQPSASSKATGKGK